MFATQAVTGNPAASGWVDGNAGQVITQIKGIAVTIVYDAVGTFIILKVIDVTLGLRVSEDVEREGLDLGLHGEVVP